MKIPGARRSSETVNESPRVDEAEAVACATRARRIPTRRMLGEHPRFRCVPPGIAKSGDAARMSACATTAPRFSHRFLGTVAGECISTLLVLGRRPRKPMKIPGARRSSETVNESPRG